jgi:hypothetical protein
LNTEGKNYRWNYQARGISFLNTDEMDKGRNNNNELTTSEKFKMHLTKYFVLVIFWLIEYEIDLGTIITKEFESINMQELLNLFE